ncbi:hypothetical protein ADE_14910 [Achromobacter denitrificans]|nr:hypothetical protein ADE_14910 [Achromobacter denitrificans]
MRRKPNILYIGCNFAREWSTGGTATYLLTYQGRRRPLGGGVSSDVRPARPRASARAARAAESAGGPRFPQMA